MQQTLSSSDCQPDPRTKHPGVNSFIMPKQSTKKAVHKALAKLNITFYSVQHDNQVHKRHVRKDVVEAIAHEIEKTTPSE